MVDLTYMNKTLALRVFILFLSCFIKKKMMCIFVVGNYDLEGLTFFSFFFFSLYFERISIISHALK